MPVTAVPQPARCGPTRRQPTASSACDGSAGDAGAATAAGAIWARTQANAKASTGRRAMTGMGRFRSGRGRVYARCAPRLETLGILERLRLRARLVAGDEAVVVAVERIELAACDRFVLPLREHAVAVAVDRPDHVRRRHLRHASECRAARVHFR